MSKYGVLSGPYYTALGLNVFSKYNHWSFKNLQLTLTRKSLLTNYNDAIYDQTSNESLHQNLESFQYSPAIAITGGIRRALSEKPFQELCFETLTLSHFQPMFHLCRNQVVGFY